MSGFSFSINIENFEAFRRTTKLISNLFFLKSDNTLYHKYYLYHHYAIKYLYFPLHFKAHSTKKGPICQLPVTSSSGYKGRNRSTSTFSTASSASACYTFHHLNPDHEYGGGDGSDLPMACQQTSKSQPSSHHPSFSGPSGSR